MRIIKTFVFATLFTLSFSYLSGQTCTAPNQCTPTPGFPCAPMSHACADGFAPVATFTEDFDNGFGVFSEDPVPVGANDLTESTAGDTQSFGTGPETTAGCDNGSNDGEFIFLEGSFTLSGEVHCMSATIPIPAVSPTSQLPHTLSFWYHMFGDNIGQMEIFIDGNSEFTVSGQQQTENCQPWLQGSIDVSAYSGTSPTVQICMSEGNGAISTFESDISIDHIQVFACAPAPELTVNKTTEVRGMDGMLFLDYTIEITNAANLAEDLVFSTEVDPKTILEPTSVMTSQGTILEGDMQGDNVVSVDLGDLGVATATITYSTKINVPAVGTYTFECQGELSTSNFCDPILTDDPDTIDVDDPTVINVNIPTMGEWGILILGLSLMIIGLVYYEQKSLKLSK